MFDFLQAVWTLHVVDALVALLLAPPLASKAPQCLPFAPVDLHLLVQDVLGHDVPLLGGWQDGEGCSYEHPNTTLSPVQKVVVALHLPPLLHAPSPLCASLFAFSPRASLQQQSMTIRTTKMVHLMNSVAAAVDITPRTIQYLQLVKRSKVDFCDNFGLELDRTHPLRKRKVWIYSSTGNFTESVIWNDVRNQTCKITTLRCRKGQINETPNINQTYDGKFSYSVCVYFVAIIRRHTQRKGRLPSWDFQC